MTKDFVSVAKYPECPFCGHLPQDSKDCCKHFKGWTDDGRTYQDKDRNFFPVLDSDVLKATGISIRVYGEAEKC